MQAQTHKVPTTTGSVPMASTFASTRPPGTFDPAPRRRPPSRRSGFTLSVHVGGTEVQLRTDEYEDGTLAEVGLSTHKEGTAFRELLRCFALSVSMGLQRGISLEEYCEAFLHTSFDPSGPVQGSEAVHSSSSVIDFAFRELASTYLSRQVPAKTGARSLPCRDEALRSSDPVVALSLLGGSVTTSRPAPAVLAPAARTLPGDARNLGFTGDVCTVCGNMTLVRSGACQLCQTCGTSTGCG